MKSHEKLFFGAIALIFIIVIAIFMFRGKDNGNEQRKDSQASTVQGNAQGNAQGNVQGNAQGNEQDNALENVQIVNGDVKLNTSEKLKQPKTIDGLNINNIQLTTKGETSQILADVENPTNSDKGDFAIRIIVIDKDGNEITTVRGYIGKVKAGGKTQLNASKTFDYSNAYDFRIEKE